ncbi:MAG TPA: formate dehydrogenase accessory sulfurtransferase FdhD [Acidimicrobiia bacterium]|nr:formate dehydrogenase accessory sulfurtransferase FdhD [Acidimicrobiia bacterium]
MVAMPTSPLPSPGPAPPGPEPGPVRRTVTPSRALAWRDGRTIERPERLATEEPMEIRAGGPGQEPVSVAVTMRTPGHDFELAVGFLVGEGLLHRRDEVASVRYCDLPPEEPQLYNVVSVFLTRPFEPAGAERRFYTTSSCGICGKASLDQVEVHCAAIPPGEPLAASVVVALPDRLRKAQRIFEQTGGLHAAGLFDRAGRVIAVREDVGRHNAVDKLVGRSLLAGEVPLSDMVLMVSGRVSFELVQKAAVAGLPVICAVSAPSSLAVEAADRFGLAVVGFVRGRGFNVYSHAERLDLDG